MSSIISIAFFCTFSTVTSCKIANVNRMSATVLTVDDTSSLDSVGISTSTQRQATARKYKCLHYTSLWVLMHIVQSLSNAAPARF